jgi:hypothetical protein
MDEAYRRSAEYKELMGHIMEDAPHLPQYLAELAIIRYKMRPQDYKKDPLHREVLKAPPSRTIKNLPEKVWENALSISSSTCEDTQPDPSPSASPSPGSPSCAPDSFPVEVELGAASA